VKIRTKDYRVGEHAKVKLKKWPTAVDPYYETKEEYQSLLSKHVHELSKLEQLMGAHNCYSLLLIFQGMDAAGKDGAIRHVMSGVNPQGCQVFSFKNPSPLELEHGRISSCIPAPSTNVPTTFCLQAQYTHRHYRSQGQQPQSMGDGMQQGLGYAEMLQVPFVFSSNGDGFLFHNKSPKTASSNANWRCTEFPAAETFGNGGRTHRGLE
jgi:hypothetical protein